MDRRAKRGKRAQGGEANIGKLKVRIFVMQRAAHRVGADLVELVDDDADLGKLVARDAVAADAPGGTADAATCEGARGESGGRRHTAEKGRGKRKR
eukprot:2205350-Pleurochrysis_carterae.AAC.1